MTRERLLTQVEGALQAAIAAAVVWIGFGAGNVNPLNIPIARAVRWAALAELVVVAVAYALLARRGRFPQLAVALAAFVGVAVMSAAWSVDPRLTAARAVSVAAVLVAGLAIAVVAARRPGTVEVALLGLVAGVVVLALAGLWNVWVDSERAIVPATIQSPPRYNGIGGNPNTMAMLIALVIPAVAWMVLAAPTTKRRIAAVGVLALLYGSLVASGSRGALLGALLGTAAFAFAARLGRRAWPVVACALALFALGVLALEVPQPADKNPVQRPQIVPPQPPVLAPGDVQAKLPLESEVGFPRPGEDLFRRTLLTSSGRLDAWRGALEQALDRPLLGYGFGTEERVFADHYYLHYSERPENAYLGTVLQVGFFGFALLVVALAIIGRRAWLVEEPTSAACAGAVVCGLVLAVSQSYLTSVGSPAMLPFWLSALLLVGATQRAAARRPGHRERKRDEREQDAPQRHGEPGLDVVGRKHDGVGREEHDGSTSGASSGDRQRGAG
jgi:hypothetical protein